MGEGKEGRGEGWKEGGEIGVGRRTGGGGIEKGKEGRGLGGRGRGRGWKEDGGIGKGKEGRGEIEVGRRTGRKGGLGKGRRGEGGERKGG